MDLNSDIILLKELLKISIIIEMMARNNSGSLGPRLNLDSFCAALAQKDKMIAILEKEV